MAEGVRLLVKHWATLNQAIEQGFGGKNRSAVSKIQQDDEEIEDIWDLETLMAQSNQDITSLSDAEKREWCVSHLCNLILVNNQDQYEIEEFLSDFMLGEFNVIIEPEQDSSAVEISRYCV